jgi:hypothetical protein
MPFELFASANYPLDMSQKVTYTLLELTLAIFHCFIPTGPQGVNRLATHLHQAYLRSARERVSLKDFHQQLCHLLRAFITFCRFQTTSCDFTGEELILNPVYPALQNRLAITDVPTNYTSPF